MARLHAHPRRRLTLLVGVDGPGLAQSANGVTFTRALVAADPAIELVALADFACPAAEADGEGEPAIPAWRRLRSQLLLPLARDEAARYRRGLPAAGGAWREVATGGIVVVEGPGACMRQLAPFYDFRIWVEAGPAPAGQARPETAPAGAEAGAPDLRVDVSGRLPHDPALEYVRLGRAQPPAR